MTTQEKRINALEREVFTLASHLNDLKNSMEELLDLIEHNTHDMWNSNLKDTTTCILLEDKELKDMVDYDECGDKDFKNHTFTGDKLRRRLNFLRQYINATKTK
tara:strand:- start:396 stop:707 length:312 start_codon:yes stop_codon:yes gene_type:complete